jgi:DNA-binding response OmpR family regulator
MVECYTCCNLDLLSRAKRRCRSSNSRGATLTKLCTLAARVMARVLIIDDDLSVGAAIRLTLTRHGAHAEHTLTANSGLQAFRSSDFDLVIVDLFMPEKNGLEIIGKLRELAPKVSILAISGFRFRNSMDPGLDFLGMAEKVGAAAVLPKPFTPRQLTATIEAILKEPLAGVGCA